MAREILGMLRMMNTITIIIITFAILISEDSFVYVESLWREAITILKLRMERTVMGAIQLVERGWKT